MCKKWFKALENQRGFLRLWAGLWMAGLCVWSAPLLAQGTVLPEQTVKDLSQESAPLILEVIEALKTQANQSSELDASTKAKLQDLYDQVLTQLKEAKEAQDQQLGFDQNREAIPARLEAIKTTREQTDLPELPVEPASQDQIQQALSQAALELEQSRTRGLELELEPKRRADRRTLILEESNTLKQSLLALDEQINTAAQTSPVDKANLHLLRAKNYPRPTSCRH